ncbi:hypothetical protein SK128_023556 [Halocaridina rubra]|uniref:Ketimine reductase mu-crystallin n=1 Tax=Halocaridina rubra TaxID=373956 RepID=A0AAN8WEZ6_HALRR
MAFEGLGKQRASKSIKWISEEDIRRLLTWDSLLKEVRECLMAVTRGPQHPEGAVQPLRAKIPVYEDGVMLVMPGFVKGQGALATKILTHYPNNASKNISTHHAMILLMNASTGVPAAVLDGEVITEMRTAAASAVATLELVQRKGKDLDADKSPSPPGLIGVKNNGT